MDSTVWNGLTAWQQRTLRVALDKELVSAFYHRDITELFDLGFIEGVKLEHLPVPMHIFIRLTDVGRAAIPADVESLSIDDANQQIRAIP